MTKPIDYGNSTIKAKKFVGEVSAEVSAEDVSATAPATDASWTDVQTALTDIASRLATLEAT